MSNDRLITRTEVERLVGINRSGIYRAMREGRFPEPFASRTEERAVAAVRSRGVDRESPSLPRRQGGLKWSPTPFHTTWKRNAPFSAHA